MNAALEISEVVKEYPLRRSWQQLAQDPFGRSVRRALDGLTLALAAGERVALVGPNGAGKTTLARIAAGVVAADAGRVRVAGADPASGSAWRDRVGLARPDDPALHPRLEARECLRFHAALYGASGDAIDELLARVDATALARRRVQTLSGGERARISLAKALLHRPRLLLLDELSRVLDPGAAARIRAVLADYAAAGGAVLLITHDLAEAAQCDRVIVLLAGRVAAQGSWIDVEDRAREVFGL